MIWVIHGNMETQSNNIKGLCRSFNPNKTLSSKWPVHLYIWKYRQYHGIVILSAVDTLSLKKRGFFLSHETRDSCLAAGLHGHILPGLLYIHHFLTLVYQITLKPCIDIAQCCQTMKIYIFLLISLCNIFCLCNGGEWSSVCVRSTLHTLKEMKLKHLCS